MGAMKEKAIMLEENGFEQILKGGIFVKKEDRHKEQIVYNIMEQPVGKLIWNEGFGPVVED